MTSLDFQTTQSADKCTEGGLRAESASAFSCESQSLFRQATNTTSDTSCNFVPSLTIDCGPGTNIRIPEGLNRDVQIHVGDSNPDPPIKSPRGDYFPSGRSGPGGKAPDRSSDREDCDTERGSDQRRHHHGDPEGFGNRSHQREDFDAFMRRMEDMFSRSAFNRYGDHHSHTHYDRQPVMRVPDHEYDRPYDNRYRGSDNGDHRVRIPEHGDFLGRIIAGNLARGFDQSPGQSLSEIRSPISGIPADLPLRFAPSPIPGISTAQLLHDAPSPREALNPLKVAEFTVKEPLKGLKNLLKGKLF